MPHVNPKHSFGSIWAQRMRQQPALIPESVTSAGLRTRALMVREGRADPASLARHLELAADEIDRLNSK